MVDIAGAAAGPQLVSRPDPLQTGSQASQIATETIAPEQASGVTAPGNIDSEGEGTGGQNGFENPASGDNRVLAQLEGSERPLSPIEEAIRDFPPDAVVQQERDLEAEGDRSTETESGNPAERRAGGEGAAVAQDGDSQGSSFGVTESEAAERAQAAAREESERAAVNEESGPEQEPRTNLTGASDNPFNLANGSAGETRPVGQPAAQPPGSTVDIAA